MVTDFMRSATAIVAGVEAVAGVTDNERGLVEMREELSFFSSRVCRPRVVEGARP